jgi:hypothetical protein
MERAATKAMSASSRRRVTTRSSRIPESRSEPMLAASTCSSSRFHESGSAITVPEPWRTRTRPFSCSIFTDSRTTVRLTENVSQSAGSVGRVLPGG